MIGGYHFVNGYGTSRHDLDVRKHMRALTVKSKNCGAAQCSGGTVAEAGLSWKCTGYLRHEIKTDC